MVLKLDIAPQTEARLRVQAEAAGKDVGTYVLELVEHAASVLPASNNSADEFDRVIDELFKTDRRKLPSIPLTYSREDIYFERD